MIVGIVGAVWASTSWQDEATAATLGWNATRCLVLRRGCKCTCCKGGTALMGPRCERVSVGWADGRQYDERGAELVPAGRRKGATNSCSESVQAFALLQYRRPDGAGWSRPLTAGVFQDDFASIVARVDLFDQREGSLQIPCWIDPADPDRVSVNYVISVIESFKSWTGGFIAMAVLGGVALLLMAAGVWVAVRGC
uniref:Uncharacterized protein n=1 Tax=Cryptomonas curvata TaxID=233186 RepID=A0A7S0MIS8_9CRYP|mmetsp:Transcript_42070/g.87900  ORF Transcript_42070/g.87900 Transcript_42070/m.87900 type:complete len:196 (+) Transcript_42070:606-1193(+)